MSDLIKKYRWRRLGDSDGYPMVGTDDGLAIGSARNEWAQNDLINEHNESLEKIEAEILRGVMAHPDSYLRKAALLLLDDVLEQVKKQ